jgi:hypothetical protein
MVKLKGPESTEPKTDVPGKLNVVSVPGLGIPTFYVNHANIDLTNLDVRIRLGQIQGREGNNIHVNDVACVYMSIPHARVLVEVLARTLLQLNEPEALPPNETK